LIMIARRTIAAILTSLMVGGISGPAAAHHDPPEDQYVPDQLVIKLDPMSGASIDDVNATWGTATLETLLGSTGIHLVATPQGTDLEDLAESMESDLRVLYAEINYHTYAPEFFSHTISAWSHTISAWGDLLTPLPADDPSAYTDQYALDLLGVEEANELSGGVGTVVAVLDTGVQLDHPALAGSLTSASYDFIDDDPVPGDDPNGLDDDGDGIVDEAVGHGTHVAGVVHLVAPAAQIMPLRVLDSDGIGDLFVIAEALQFAVTNGADVINLSLGLIQESEFLEDVIEDAVEAGVVVVAAAGNLDDIQPVYPAADDEVLAVAAIGPTDQRAPFSSYGMWVDLVAPGMSVYSAYPTDRWAWWGGTSTAAPFVAAQAALLRSLDPDLDPKAVAFLMRSTAVSVDHANPSYIGLLGAGRPDLVASLEAAGYEEEAED